MPAVSQPPYQLNIGAWNIAVYQDLQEVLLQRALETCNFLDADKVPEVIAIQAGCRLSGKDDERCEANSSAVFVRG